MKRLYIYIGLFTFVSTSLLSQQDTSSIATEKIEVVKNYEAIIQQAKKKELQVVSEERVTKSFNYNYDFKADVKLDFERPDPVVRPLSFSEASKQLEDVKDGQFYAGYGTYKSLNLGGAYHYYIEDWFEAGFKVDHMSAKDADFNFQRYANTNGKLYASYFVNPKTKIGLDVNVSNSKHFTSLNGLMDSLSSTEQQFDNYGAKFSLSNNSFEKIGLALRMDASYDILQQDFDNVQEDLFMANGNIFKKVNDKSSFEIPIAFRRFNYKVDSLSNGVTDIRIQPNLNLLHEDYKLKLGVEYIKADSSNFLFPIVDFYLEQLTSAFDLNIYTSSTFDRNSVHRLSEFIPYFRSDMTNLTPNYMRSVNLKGIYYLGDWRPSLNVAYAIYDGDEVIFDRALDNRPVISSLDRNAIVISPSMNIEQENLSLSAGLDYNIFLGDNKDFLVYRPELIAYLKSSQDFSDKKVRLSQEIRYLSSRRHFHPGDNDRVLDGFVDLSLAVDFRVHENFSIYARGTNLLGSEYELAFGHPVFQRQIWAGIRLHL